MDASADDSMILVSGTRLIRSGIKDFKLQDDLVLFINSGGSEIEGQENDTSIKGDSHFHGGDVIQTTEMIIEGGDCPSLYQSARYGDFCYKFEGLSSGEYFVDLHFAEIVNTNGPKGIRVFDVFVQEEKILSKLDIYAIVGAHKPLQLVDTRVSVVDNEDVVIRFEGIRGSPTVSGISIRKAITLSAGLTKPGHLICNKCASEIEASPSQKKDQNKLIAKYEKKIEELTCQCKLKSDECYQAWMSLTDTNQQLERLNMELDNKFFQTETLEQDLEKQKDNLRDVCEKYGHDKVTWSAAITDLEGKIKAMKDQHYQLSREAHECANSIPNLNKMIAAVQSLVAECDDLKLKYSEEMAKRKKLYNQVQETKGNIRVFCRCRPLNKDEVSSGCNAVVDFDAAKDGDIGIMTVGTIKKNFKFDRVYTPKENQADVYADASPLVTSVLDGYNVCIFAYGQTGTGKTFTMEGTQKNRGVNYRTLEELFSIADERKETIEYSISVSVLEVYNEQIRDLLGTSSTTSKKLEVRQAAEGFHHVPGLVEAKVGSIKEAWDVLQAGSNARAVGSNNVNEHSSRSHCMLCIMVKARNLMNGECTRSKLWLIDLAGSERLAKTDVQGERLKEAQNINKSLSALGDVISALAAKSSHIPYRNSKLTHLLQDSLGGDSKALMFVQISPAETDMGETLSSLNFASRVRGIELGPAKKQVDTAELQKMKQMLDRVRQDCKVKDDSLRKLEENCQNLENKVTGKEQLLRALQEKIKDLEGQLKSKSEQQGLSERQHWQLSEALKGKEEAISVLQQKVKELDNKLMDQQHSESVALQEKVRELQVKLKEQSHSEAEVTQKVKELEYKLKESMQSELFMEQKVKDLESKLREEKEQSDPMILLHSADSSRIATPIDARAFSKHESTSEIDPQILRTSNSINKPPVRRRNSILLKATESLHETKRKRDIKSPLVPDHENAGVISTMLLEKKMAAPAEPSKVRKIDTTKAFGRLARTSKGPTTQKMFLHTKITTKEQQAGGVKAKDNLRVWSR